MKKIFILFALISTICRSQVYIGSHKINVDLDDKTAHVFAGAFISSSVHCAHYSLTKQKNFLLSGYFGTSAGYMAGLCKEIYDTQKANPTGFSVNDMLATSYGSFMGFIAVTVVIDNVEKHKLKVHPELYQNLNKTTP